VLREARNEIVTGRLVRPDLRKFMRPRTAIVVAAYIFAASGAMLLALPQSGRDIVPFHEDYFESAVFIDVSLQLVRQDSATASDQRAPPLFGMETEPVGGEVATKWRAVEAEIDREQQISARCRSQDACPVAAKNLADIVAEGAGRSGLARVGLINRAVNLYIMPTSDEAQWGVADRWSPPFETLQT
jgi:hypothetical protein